MKIKKLYQNLITKSLNVSFKEGKIDEGKVLKLIRDFKTLPKTDAISLLSQYLRGLKRIINQHTLTIESVVSLSPEEIKKVAASLKNDFQIYNTENKINPNLFGGIKISVGDYIIDDSIKNRISQVEKTIKQWT